MKTQSNKFAATLAAISAIVLALFAVPLSASAVSGLPSVGAADANLSTAQASQQEPTGVIIPVFVQPISAEVSEYNEAIRVKTMYPNVPMIVVVNPANGPGAYSSDIAAAVGNMQAAGITVLGYSTTSWGERDVASIEIEISNYKQWYNVNGIYLDEMPNWDYNSPSGGWYYSGPDGVYLPQYFSTLTTYAKSLGMTKVTGNAGADVPPDFIGSVDTIGIWENGFLPSLSTAGGWTSLAGVNAWHLGYDKSNFMFFAYNVLSLDPRYISGAANYMGFLYITDRPGPAPYNELPSYFSQLVSILSSLDGGVVGVGASTSQLTIGSQDTSGHHISGYHVAVYAPSGSLLGTGFTPATFTLNNGDAYGVQVANYGSCSFSHWADTGSTSNPRAVPVSSNAQLTAVYDCGGGGSGAGGGGSGTSTFSVSTVNSAGSHLAGYYVSLWQSGAQVRSCFSPCSFAVNGGQRYQVAVADYGSEAFSHWSDGTTSRFYTLNLPGGSSTTIGLTAVYVP